MSVVWVVISLWLGVASLGQQEPKQAVSPPGAPPASAPTVTVPTPQAPSDDKAMAPPVDQRPEGADRAGASEPSSPSAAVRRAAALAEAGKMREAIQLMDIAVERFEDRAELLWTLALLYRDTGDKRKTEELLLKARAADPNNGQVQAEFAALLEQRGDYPEALAAANRAVVLLPRDPGVRADRAIIRFRMGQLDGAIQDMRRATRERPRDPDLRLNHALIRLARGRDPDIKRAIDLIQSLRRELPEDDQVALAEAVALAAAKRDRESKRVLDAILARSPGQGWAAFVRGLIAWRAGDTLKADSLGRIARTALPKEFLPQRYMLRRFFIRDSKGYLKWLDDRVSGRDTGAPPRPPRRPLRLSGLRVEGACDRRIIRMRLSPLVSTVQTCFGTRSGRLKTRLVLERGLVQDVAIVGAGVHSGTDACVLDAMTGLSWDEGDCEVSLTWFRGTHGPHREETNPAATTLDVVKPSTRLSPPARSKLDAVRVKRSPAVKVKGKGARGSAVRPKASEPVSPRER